MIIQLGPETLRVRLNVCEKKKVCGSCAKKSVLGLDLEQCVQDSEKAKRMAGGVRKSQVSWSPFLPLFEMSPSTPLCSFCAIPYLTHLSSQVSSPASWSSFPDPSLSLAPPAKSLSFLSFSISVCLQVTPLALVSHLIVFLPFGLLRFRHESMLSSS